MVTRVLSVENNKYPWRAIDKLKELFTLYTTHHHINFA